MGCVLSFGTAGTSLAQNINKNTKVQKSNTKKVNQKALKKHRQIRKEQMLFVKKTTKELRLFLLEVLLLRQETVHLQELIIVL